MCLSILSACGGRGVGRGTDVATAGCTQDEEAGGWVLFGGKAHTLPADLRLALATASGLPNDDVDNDEVVRA